MSAVQQNVQTVDWHSDAIKARRKSRYAAETRLKAYGLIAIVFALGFLTILIGSLTVKGYKAFEQTVGSVEIDLATSGFDRDKLMDANWKSLVKKALLEVGGAESLKKKEPVSYTHLTLPTTPYV